MQALSHLVYFHFKGKTIMASTLVVLKFDTPEGADEGLAIAAKLQQEHLLEIQDIATVTWPEGKKKPKTHHGQGACGGAWYGAFWGMLIGFIFFVPFLGAAWGAAMVRSAPRGPITVLATISSRTSAARLPKERRRSFLLVGQVTGDRVKEAFQAAPKFEVIASNLSHEQEEKLKDAFAH